MRSVFWKLLLLACVRLSCAPAQDPGFTPEWDIRPVLKEIAAHAQRLVPGAR